MTTKQYLSQYRKFMADIVFYETLKEEAIYNVSSLKSPQLGGDRVQTSPQNDPIGALVIELERDIAKYNIEILSCKAKMILISNQIDHMREVNEDYFKILTYRYKIGMDWKDISQKMLLGMSTVTHLHCPALQHFEKLFGENYINA